MAALSSGFDLVPAYGFPSSGFNSLVACGFLSSGFTFYHLFVAKFVPPPKEIAEKKAHKFSVIYICKSGGLPVRSIATFNFKPQIS